MILIFEGPDKAGKSTIIEKLREGMLYNRNCVVVKHSHPKDSAFLIKEIKKLADSYPYLGLEGLIIFDRWYLPSDIVYSPVVLQRPSILEPYISNVERLLISRGAAYVYTTASLDVLLKRYDELGDDYITREQLKEILERYEYFFSLTQVPHIDIVTDKSSPQALAYMIDNQLPSLYHRVRAAQAIYGF